MTVRIFGLKAVNNGTGVFIQEGSDVQMSSVSLTGNQTGLVVGSERALLAEYFVKAVEQGMAPDDARAIFGDRLKSCGFDLDAHIARGANLATIAALVLQAFGRGG